MSNCQSILSATFLKTCKIRVRLHFTIKKFLLGYTSYLSLFVNVAKSELFESTVNLNVRWRKNYGFTNQDKSVKS